MLVLGIETSCDETGAAVVKDGKDVLSNVVASSADLHAAFGGVFPEHSSRRQVESIALVIEQALEEAEVDGSQIDLIAVAKGPGLIGPLLVGMQFAKGLSIAWKKPLIGVNHVEAHLYAAMMGSERMEFPALGLVLSGGHTLMVRIDGVGQYKRIGTTVDDAIGEAFDKVGVQLGLAYPGGPKVEAMAKNGSPRFKLAPGRVKDRPLDFSFSGLKTSVLYAMQGQNGMSPKNFNEQDKADLAASFQETALADVVGKAKEAAGLFDCRAVYLGGGVCNNLRLKEMMRDALAQIPVIFPEASLTLDNGAMIAGLGYQKFLMNPVSDPLDLEAQTRIPIA